MNSQPAFSAYPTLTPLTGPSNGIHAIRVASEPQIIPNIARSSSRSNERGVTEITTSLIIPLGNIGLSVRSTIRAYSVTSSVGLPSLFLYGQPQILPAALKLSLKSIVRGKKSLLGFGSLFITAVTSTSVSPNFTLTAPSQLGARIQVLSVSCLPARS